MLRVFNKVENRQQAFPHKLGHSLPITGDTEYAIPQLRMMIREVEEIMSKEITADEWNCL